MVETLWIPVSHLIEITGDYGQQRAGPGRSCFNYSQNNSGYSSRSWTPARERDNLHSRQQVAEPLSQRKDLKDLPPDKDYRELLPSQIQIFILTTLVKVQRWKTRTDTKNITVKIRRLKIKRKKKIKTRNNKIGKGNLSPEHWGRRGGGGWIGTAQTRLHISLYIKAVATKDGEFKVSQTFFPDYISASLLLCWSDFHTQHHELQDGLHSPLTSANDTTLIQ